MKNILVTLLVWIAGSAALAQTQSVGLTKDVLPLILGGRAVSCTDVTGGRQLCLTQKGDQISLTHGGGTGSNNGGAVEIVIELAGQSWPTPTGFSTAGQDPRLVEFKKNLKKFLLQIGTANGRYSHRLDGEGDYWTDTTDGIGWRVGSHYTTEYGFFTFDILITSNKIIIRHFAVG